MLNTLLSEFLSYLSLQSRQEIENKQIMAVQGGKCLYKEGKRLGMVAEGWNPSYPGGRA
jgi:hypothetical protein